jgi:hypothetical protein
VADYFGAAESLLGGIGGFLGGSSASKGASAAAQSYATAARLSMASNQIKQSMVSRDLYKTLGGMRASASSSGLQMSGNVLDLIRDSARQGAISKAVVGLQGQIDYNSYMAQSSAASAQASASKSGGFLSGLGGIIGMGASLFSDDALKEDVTLLRRREDGIGVYRFRYTGSNEFFEGAMASDVERLRPDAIYYYDDLDLRMVDYGAIGMELRRAA